MIIREWRARADLSRADAYPRHFRTQVMPELSHIPGFLGAHLIKRPLDGGIEFVVLSRWESPAAIRGFAGDDIGRAIVEPGAAAALVDFDSTAQHYEVIEAADTPTH